MAVLFQQTYLINVYTPSGEEKRGEREDFLTIEVPNMLPKTPREIVLA
jgi:hypothetical protein